MHDLTRFGAGPAGVTMEFASHALDEAARRVETGTSQSMGAAAKKGILERLSRNADLLAAARILWVNDHPDNNAPIVELLDRCGAAIDTPSTNVQAYALMEANRYDVYISDAARDDEGERSPLKGIEFAERVFNTVGEQVVLFTARFNPSTLPDASIEEQLALSEVVSRTVFGRTNRYDEVLHLVLDVLERGI